MLEHIHEELSEIDLDAKRQLGERDTVEILVVGEGELAGMEMNLGEVRSTWVAVETSSTFDIDPENRRQLVEQAAVNGGFP